MRYSVLGKPTSVGENACHSLHPRSLWTMALVCYCLSQLRSLWLMKVEYFYNHLWVFQKILCVPKFTLPYQTTPWRVNFGEALVWLALLLCLRSLHPLSLSFIQLISVSISSPKGCSLAEPLRAQPLTDWEALDSSTAPSLFQHLQNEV